MDCCVTESFVLLFRGHSFWHVVHFTIRSAIHQPAANAARFRALDGVGNIYLVCCKFVRGENPIIFFANAVRISLAFFRAYRIAGQLADSYSAENLGQFVRWLKKSTYGIIFFGLSGSVLAFATRLGNAIYMFAGIFMFIYIYVSFRNYSVHFKEVVTAVDEGTELLRETAGMVMEQPQEKVNAKSRLIEDEKIIGRLEQWIASEGYTQTGITVSHVAVVAGTNRTYLSLYINDHFGCNFREWIVSLRIRKAKSLLAERSDLTIEQVAAMTGFSSDSYFCKQFAFAEGTSPAKWRKSQIRKSAE